MLCFKNAKNINIKTGWLILAVLIIGNCILLGLVWHLQWEKMDLFAKEQKLMSKKIAVKNELKNFTKYKINAFFKNNKTELVNTFTKMANESHVLLSSFEPDNSTQSWNVTILGKYSQLGNFFSTLFNTKLATFIRITELNFYGQKNSSILKVVLTVYDDFSKQIYKAGSTNLTFDFYRDPFVLGKARKPLGVNVWPILRLKLLGFIEKGNKKIALVSDPNNDIYQVLLTDKIGLEQKNVLTMNNKQ